MKKPFVLMMYGVALYFVLKRYYSSGNTGLPNPQTVAAPTYLYGILALAADFTGGLSVPLTAGLTVALIWQTQAQGQNQKQAAKSKTVPKTGTTSPGTKVPVKSKPANRPTAKKGN